jgi:hypothetical protein
MWVALLQGCQMVYFLTKNPNLGLFLECLGKNFGDLDFLRLFGIFNGRSVLFYMYFPVLVNCTNNNLATLPCPAANFGFNPLFPSLASADAQNCPL